MSGFLKVLLDCINTRIFVMTLRSFSFVLIAAVSALCGLQPAISYADFKSADEASKTRNWTKVFEACKADADAGEKNCQGHIGYIYKYGLGVAANHKLSAELLQKCAAQGQMYCQEMLGDSYKNGIGLKTDYAEAIRLFRLSADKGNPWAHNNMGELYRLGQGVPKDPVEAVKHFLKAAEKGNGSAQATLANMYRIGEGVKKDGEMAFTLARKSADQNFGSGWNILGLLYRDGVGVKQDAGLAIDAFRRAFSPNANSPAHIAYANLGRMYFRGIGVPIDLAEALKWADEGNRVKQRDGIALLAEILFEAGKNPQVDRARAFQLAKEAYDKGHAGSGNLLGRFYKDGVGTAVDYDLAIGYMSEAREKGVPNASVDLGRMYLEGRGVRKDSAKARELFLAAKSDMDRLRPDNQKFLEGYFVADSGTKVAAAIDKSNGVKGPQAPDGTQQALLEKLEQLQRQMETLQASNRTTNQASRPQVPVHMARRKALVIGNDKYKHVQALINAVGDATAIAKTLTQLGYGVSLHQDLTEKAFKQALRDFRGSLEGGDEVLFFFAGHGVQLGAANYLLPTDTRGDNEEQVKDEAIELQRVLDDLKSKNAKFALAIIDACRDNPFKQSGRAIGGRGLAPTTAATGQMIMFSAGTGQQALDKLSSADPDKNGVFTRVLLREMIKPGIPVDRILRNVRNEVVSLSKSVGHEQTPALYDQAVGDFYFALK